MTLREILAVRNEALLAVTAGYHSRRRTVPMSPQELEAARRRRYRKRVVAGVIAHLAGETLLVETAHPRPDPERAMSITNPRPYACWLCPDPTCRAHQPGHRLHLRAWAWAGGNPEPQKRPTCTVCRREEVLLGAGETYQPEATTPHKETMTC